MSSSPQPCVGRFCSNVISPYNKDDYCNINQVIVVTQPSSAYPYSSKYIAWVSRPKHKMLSDDTKESEWNFCTQAPPTGSYGEQTPPYILARSPRVGSTADGGSKHKIGMFSQCLEDASSRY